MSRVVHTRPGRWPEIKPDRFAARIRRDSPGSAKLALIGFPDDTGVRLNGGRPGAALGPDAFRRALASFGVAYDGALQAALDVDVFDAGDVEPAPGTDAAALSETHARVEAAVSELHRLGMLPVGIGGGHDLTLPAVAALSKAAGRAVGGIAVDAHLDVRERVGSGMPFRRLIDAQCLEPRHFVSFGLGRFINDASDWAWLRDRGATLIGIEQALDAAPPPRSLLDRALAGSAPGFLSIDLDALDSSVAPGVSATNPMGLAVRPVAALAEAAGLEPRVRHFDLMELSPPHDPEGRTARVAAFLFLSFVAGFARRSP